MDLQGKPPSEKQFEILMRMHADANRGLRLYYVYEKMKKFGVKPRVFLYDKIIYGLVRTDHLDLACQFAMILGMTCWLRIVSLT